MSYIQNFDRRMFLDINGAPAVPYQIIPPNTYYTTPINSCVSPINPYQFSYDQFTSQNPSTVMNFKIRYLVSNVMNIEGNFDIELSDPWGIIIIDDIIWVANSGSGFVSGYNLIGEFYLSINAMGSDNNIVRPSGLAYNSSDDSFILSRGPIREPSLLLIASLDGSISGYNPIVDAFNSKLLVDRGPQNAVYTGIEVVSLIDDDQIRINLLYVTDFFNKTIDVFTGNLEKLDYYFVDEFSSDPIPPDFSPCNIVALDQYLFVIYAKQNPSDLEFVIGGTGTGFISIFSFDGSFIKRFYSRGVLNAPYDIAYVPSSYGYPAGSMMISNYGDGSLNIFDVDGNYISTISDASQNTINFGGLRGLCHNSAQHRLTYFTTTTNYLNNSFVGTLFNTLS